MSHVLEPPIAAEPGLAVRTRRPLRPQTLAPARRRLDPKVAASGFQAADAAALVLLSLAGSATAEPAALAAAGLAACGTAIALRLAGAYRFPRGERPLSSLARTALALLLAQAALRLLAPQLTPAQAWVDPAMLGTLLALHLGWFVLTAHWRAQGLLTPSIAIIGATPIARALILELLNGRSAGEASVVGIFDDRAQRAPREILGVPVLGGVDELLRHRALPSIERIVITVPEGAARRVAAIVDRLSSLPHEIVLVVGEPGDEGAGRLGGLNLARLGGRPVAARRAAVKRAQDVLLSGLAVIAASPVLLAVALAVKLDSPGPVFFRQKRQGFNNEEFWVLKFRSMRVEAADASAARQVSADDDRVTRVGRFIRRTSLDELPQLINVLRGEMSLVGPRPHAVGMKAAGHDAASLVNSYSHRHRLKPGLTGLAAVRGSRGPVDDVAAVERRVRLDLEYIERQSFWLDLWIMLRTAPLVLGDGGAVR